MRRFPMARDSPPALAAAFRISRSQNTKKSLSCMISESLTKIESKISDLGCAVEYSVALKMEKMGRSPVHRDHIRNMSYNNCLY